MNDRVRVFEKAVEQYLNQNNFVSLEELFAADKSKQLLIEPRVMAYLTRQGVEIEFDESGEPILESGVEKEMGLDNLK